MKPPTCRTCLSDDGYGIRLCPLHAAAEDMRTLLRDIVEFHTLRERPSLNARARALLARLGAPSTGGTTP